VVVPAIVRDHRTQARLIEESGLALVPPLETAN
jgi:hypothetical protein